MGVGETGLRKVRRRGEEWGTVPPPSQGRKEPEESAFDDG